MAEVLVTRHPWLLPLLLAVAGNNDARASRDGGGPDLVADVRHRVRGARDVAPGAKEGDGGQAAPAGNPARFPEPTSGTASRPRGIFALSGWSEAPRAETWRNPLIDGVVLRVYWKDVNPSPDVLDFAWLDRQFQLAAEHRKQIHLIVAPGFYSPQWVLGDEKVKTAPFDVPGGPHTTVAAARPLPLPWDERYLDLWLAFVDKVAQRYRESPQLGYVSLTGPNSHNGEMSLPRSVADEKSWLALCGGDAGVFRKNMTGAWYRTIDRICTAFRGKHATLAVILKSQPLAQSAEAEDAYVAEIASYGASRYPQTFGLQTNGLDGRPLYPADKGSPPQWRLVREYSGKLLVGFQTREPRNLYGGPRREAKEQRLAIFRQALIGNALPNGPDFVEIYETDANDPALSDVITEAGRALKK